MSVHRKLVTHFASSLMVVVMTDNACLMGVVSAEDWRYRRAALMAISAIGEGCGKQMKPILEDVVNVVLPFCQDTHYRVRYAACNALGQMANDFAYTLQRKFHDKVRGV